MDIKLIKTLIQQMDQSTLTKLEIEQEGVRICMERALPQEQPIVRCTQTEPKRNEESHAFEDGMESYGVHMQEVATHGTYVTSPMVGTFYEAAGPDHAPYVRVGDYVKKGQVLCIIESMKLMNEIEAEVEGEVVAILIQDKEMVEYGQKLFEIAPR